MAQYRKSQDHDITARVERALEATKAGDLNTIKSSNLEGFCGCHNKNQHTYSKSKDHRQKGSQEDGTNITRGHLRCKRGMGYPAYLNYKHFSGIIQSKSSISLRRERLLTVDTTLNKCQTHKDRKYKENGKILQRSLLKTAEREIVSESSIKSRSVTSGIIPTNSSTNLTSSKSRILYPESNSMPIKHRSTHQGPKKSHKTNIMSIGSLPKRYSKSKSRRRSFFYVYSKLLFLHNKRRIKPKTTTKKEANKAEIIPIIYPAIRKKNRKPYHFEQNLPNNIQVSKLSVYLSSNCTPSPVAFRSMTQNVSEQDEQSLTRCISFPKSISKPYAKTVTVYTVYDQRPTKRKPSVDLSTKSSFNVKFYKSMGDGRQIFGDGFPYMQIPRNYSPTNMARAGRDEDGCICVCIPQENYYGSMEPRCDDGQGFLKRYFRVLLKSNNRSVKRCHPQRRCPHGNSRPNRCQNVVGCKYKYSSPGKNFRGNDAACQCKRKERRERRSDDIFCRDRGTTCSVPTCPDNENKSNTDNVINALNNDQQRDKNAVNIGSNFSFQVGLYKRSFDTNPNQSAFSTNQTTYSEPKRDDYYFVNVPANDPSLRYMEGDARYSTGRGGDDCCCSASDVSACCEPSPSLLSELLKKTPRKVKCRSESCSPYDSDQTISQCSSPPSPRCSARSYFLKQFERSDLCCNKLPKSHCKPKHKAIRCRCDKKPKVVGCSDSKKNVGIVCSTSNSSSSTASASCKCYKVKNIGCCCSNEPILAECPKKKGCCNNCRAKASKKSRKICRSRCSTCPTCEETRSCCKRKKSKKKKKCCCCDQKKGLPSLWNHLFCKDEEPCCCCNKRKFSLGRTFSMLFQKKRCCKCNLRKPCKCHPKSGESKSGEFDYKKVLNNLKISSRLRKQPAKPCPCGELNVMKVLSSLLLPPEPQQQTKAQQSKGSGDFDIKRMFGRLLLFNTVEKQICCSGVSYDQNSRSVGIGEVDYRKLPPCLRSPDRSQGDCVAVRNFVSKLVKPETNTRMHYSAFNPLNQCEAGMQHISRIGPDDRAGATVCRNQGICAPKSKPMTVRDCENANCQALQSLDPKRKAVRIGSSCSFSLEFYKGMPPSKAGPPPCPPTCNRPCPPTCNRPCPAPCVDTPVCNPTSRPCRPSQPFLQRAAKYMITNTQKPKLKPTCKKCNNCMKVPIIKRGFAHLILRDKRPLQAARPCQKTNTIQPNRKLVTRKQNAGAAKGLGANVKCDPYVCLKRINQRKCCK